MRNTAHSNSIMPMAKNLEQNSWLIKTMRSDIYAFFLTAKWISISKTNELLISFDVCTTKIITTENKLWPLNIY